MSLRVAGILSVRSGNGFGSFTAEWKIPDGVFPSTALAFVEPVNTIP